MAKKSASVNPKKSLKDLEKENRELKQIIAELRESEEKYRTIVENANDHIDSNQFGIGTGNCKTHLAPLLDATPNQNTSPHLDSITDFIANADRTRGCVA